MLKMKRENLVKLGKWIGAFAVIIATVEANAPCPYITYQPEKPESVKNLRKF